MQTETVDWIDEIDKIAERSIKRNEEILKDLEKNNLEAATKDDNTTSN